MTRFIESYHTQGMFTILSLLMFSNYRDSESRMSNGLNGGNGSHIFQQRISKPTDDSWFLKILMKIFEFLQNITSNILDECNILYIYNILLKVHRGPVRAKKSFRSWQVAGNGCHCLQEILVNKLLPVKHSLSSNW